MSVSIIISPGLVLSVSADVATAVAERSEILALIQRQTNEDEVYYNKFTTNETNDRDCLKNAFITKLLKEI